jgi:hypothetical protein
MTRANDQNEYEAYWQVLQSSSISAADDAFRVAEASRGSREERDRKIAEKVASDWRDGWRYFDAVIFAMEQNGLAMLDRSGKVEDGYSPVRDALMLLHCSATHTLHEIRRLLLGGHWVGAAARWRALHEVAVTATVIAHHGPPIAQRYLDHGFVVQTRRLAEFRAEYGRGPVSAEKLAERLEEGEAIALGHAFGGQSSKFHSQYGWAAPLMPVAKSGRRVPPSFDALERMAGMEHFRLLVVSAHGHVHNDPAGVRSAVLMEEGDWSLSPIARFTETIARPTMMTVTRLVPVTHLAFEPELNDFLKVLGMLGTALCENANRGIEAFTVAEPAP